MRNQQWRDPQWRTRICCVLAGAIFVASQFAVAGAPPRSDDPAAKIGRGDLLSGNTAVPSGRNASVLAETDVPDTPLD